MGPRVSVCAQSDPGLPVGRSLLGVKLSQRPAQGLAQGGRPIGPHTLPGTGASVRSTALCLGAMRPEALWIPGVPAHSPRSSLGPPTLETAACRPQENHLPCRLALYCHFILCVCRRVGAGVYVVSPANRKVRDGGVFLATEHLQYLVHGQWEVSIECDAWCGWI